MARSVEIIFYIKLLNGSNNCLSYQCNLIFPIYIYIYIYIFYFKIFILENKQIIYVFKFNHKLVKISLLIFTINNLKLIPIIRC